MNRIFRRKKLLLTCLIIYLIWLITQRILDKRKNDLLLNEVVSISIHQESVPTISCVPYVASDNRSFFERESRPLNPPRRVSYASDDELFRYLRSIRLITLVCARNVEKYVDQFRKHIEPIVDLFHPTSSIHILQSDSTDGTLVKLYQWSRAQIYSRFYIDRSIQLRHNRIAHCRNELLNRARQLTSDYIFFVDFDGFTSNISSFISNFRYHTDDWSVMTASASSSYYDIWALRTLSDEILNFDIWRKVRDLQNIQPKYCPESVVDQIVTLNQKAIPSHYGLIEVRSAFGGAGIYKMSATIGCNYTLNYEGCEHVPFHLCLREKNQARIFINPEFLIS